MLTIIQHCRSAHGSATGGVASTGVSGSGGVGSSIATNATNMYNSVYSSVMSVFGSNTHKPVPLALESTRDTTNPVAMFTIDEEESDIIIDSEDNCDVSSGVGSGLYTVVGGGSVKTESVSGVSEKASGGVSQDALFLIVTVRLLSHHAFSIVRCSSISSLVLERTLC